MSVHADLTSRAKARPEHPNSWIFFNGEFQRYHDVRLGFMTHALHYGTGCFEGIRAYWNQQREQLFLLPPVPHYARLRNSSKILRMTLPHSTEELTRITVELLRRNEYRSDVYIRPLM